MSLNITSFAAALKTYYSKSKIEALIYKRNPFFQMVDKVEDLGGDNWKLPLIYADSQGVSNTFATAQAIGDTSSPGIAAWLISRVSSYGVATVTDEAIQASKGDMVSFLRARTVAMDSIVRQLGRSIAVAMYGDTSGYVGQVLAEPATNASTFQITVKYLPQITNFEVGQNLVIWSAKTGGTQRNSDGADTVWPIAAIDRDTGVITLTGTYDGSGTIAANDYVFYEGSRGNAMAGLEAWLPETVSSSDSFFNVNRSIDRVRLAGSYVQGAGLPIQQALTLGANQVALNGGAATHCFMNFTDYQNLVTSLGSQVVRVKHTTNIREKGTTIAFDGIQIFGPNSTIDIYPDQNCNRQGIAYVLDMSTWQLGSIGKAVSIVDADGLSMLRQASANGYEMRFRFYGNLGCTAPGFNAAVEF